MNNHVLGDTRRGIYRAADILQTLDAAAAAAQHYDDVVFRRGFLAALAVVAAAHGLDWSAGAIVDAHPPRARGCTLDQND